MEGTEWTFLFLQSLTGINDTEGRQSWGVLRQTVLQLVLMPIVMMQSGHSVLTLFDPIGVLAGPWDRVTHGTQDKALEG